MLTTLHRVIVLEDIPADRLTVKNAAMLTTFRIEKSKAEARRAPPTV